MANHGLELPGEVVAYDQTGIRHLYTILGWPRSIVISRNSRSNRPLYTTWSQFTCKLCQFENYRDMVSLQLHMAEQHGLDLRGTREYSRGQLMVWVKPYDTTDQTLGYNLREFTVYHDHYQDPLYIKIHKIRVREPRGVACLVCPHDEHMFHSEAYLLYHMGTQHGIDIKGKYMKHLVDETGYHFIDTRVTVDPLSIPSKQILSTADRENNDTQEGCLTAYDETGMILYTLQPFIKPKLKNSCNDFLYTTDTRCVCQICLLGPETNIDPTMRLVDLKRHMRTHHNISLNHPYYRQHGKITFQSTKVFDMVDEILDENKTALICDQNGTPVVYKKLSQTPPYKAWFCLRCGLQDCKGKEKSYIFNHLNLYHNLLIHQELVHCYLSPVGDFVCYLVEDQHIPTGPTRPNLSIKRPWIDSNENIEGLAPEPKLPCSAIFGGKKYCKRPRSTEVPATQAPQVDPNANFVVQGQAFNPLNTYSPAAQTALAALAVTQGAPPAVQNSNLQATQQTSNTAQYCPYCLGNCQCHGVTGTTPSSSNTGQPSPTTSGSKVKHHDTAPRYWSKTGQSARTTLWSPRSRRKARLWINTGVETSNMPKPRSSFVPVQSALSDCTVCQILNQRCAHCKAKEQEKLISQTTSVIKPATVTSSSQNLVTSAPMTFHSQNLVTSAPVTSHSQNLVTYAPVTSHSQGSVSQADTSQPTPHGQQSCVFCGQLMTDCECFPDYT